MQNHVLTSAPPSRHLFPPVRFLVCALACLNFRLFVCLLGCLLCCLNVCFPVPQNLLKSPCLSTCLSTRLSPNLSPCLSPLPVSLIVFLSASLSVSVPDPKSLPKSPKGLPAWMSHLDQCWFHRCDYFLGKTEVASIILPLAREWEAYVSQML